MTSRCASRLGALVTLGLLVVGVTGMSAATASNTVPSSKAGSITAPVSPNELAPPRCAALTLNSVVVPVAATVTGTSENDLVLGNLITVSLEGAAGDDCLVGGALGETLVGGAGYDICIGGPGLDLFDPSCEEQYQ